MKTNITTLFETYQVLIDNRENSAKIFENSGMKNISRKLYFGFFPLGSGIFTEQSKIKEAEISENGIMFLGNDFGTVSYFESLKNKSEENNKTIQMLKKLDLNLENSFFTNFHLGLRDNNEHKSMTNIKKTIKFNADYEEMCYNYFLVQLEVINPRLIICLGKDVGKILSKKSDIFAKFNMKNKTFKSLFESKECIVETNDEIFDKRRFLLIPHPSYAHLNWNEKILNLVNKEIKNASR